MKTGKNIKPRTGQIYLFLFIALLASCANEQAEKKTTPAISIETGKVIKKEIALPVVATGLLFSETQSNLSFLTGGIIKNIYVNEGDIVKKGDKLASLNLTEINSKAKQAAIAFDKAKRDLKRAENLYSDSVATLEQLQNARSAFDLAKTNVSLAEYNKEHSIITAPSDGKILKKLKEVNEIAAPGHPLFVFASTETGWVLRINPADRDFVKISLNDSASVQFDAFPGEKFAAVVSELANAAGLQTGTYETELRLLNMPKTLVAGLIGTAEIFPSPKSQILLPADAIIDGNQLQVSVYVLKDGIAEKRKIELLGIYNDFAMVKNGISEGEIVITEGKEYISKGSKLSLKSQ